MLKPYFYVNVTDIDSLQEQPFYSACKSNLNNLYEIEKCG